MPRVREAAATERHLDDDLWAAMAEQGWPAVERSVEDGGLGLGMVEVAVLCEQLGRHLAPVPFAGTVMAHGALAAAITSGALDPSTPLGDGDAGGWAQQLASGEATGAVAWSRRADAVHARRDGGGTWRLTGRTDPVIDGPYADIVVVFAENAENAENAETARPQSRPWTAPAAWGGSRSRTGPRCGSATVPPPTPCSTGLWRRRAQKCSVPPTSCS